MICSMRGPVAASRIARRGTECAGAYRRPRASFMDLKGGRERAGGVPAALHWVECGMDCA
jgi:hypothetical protein